MEQQNRMDFEQAPERKRKQETPVNLLMRSLDGRYTRIDKVIGKGSFKTVYTGRDEFAGVDVAWCELSTNFMEEKERADSAKEFVMLQQLQHPSIIRSLAYWDAKTIEGHLRSVLVTEYMSSGPLRKYIQTFHGHLQSSVIVKWSKQILSGLDYLHKCQPPIIHRDLNCNNIFISGSSGEVKIGDFGLATWKESQSRTTGTAVGTSGFMAPEVYEGHYTVQTDIFAYGMCVLEMASKEVPYCECRKPVQTMRNVCIGYPPKSLKKAQDPAVMEVICICTSFYKQNRPTIQELLQWPMFSQEVPSSHCQVRSVGPALQLPDTTDLGHMSTPLYTDVEQQSNQGRSLPDARSISNKFLEEKDLMGLASLIGSEWRQLGINSLGLSKADIDHCMANNPLTLVDKVFDMLSLWRKRIENGATVRKLYDLFEKSTTVSPETLTYLRDIPD